MRIAPGRSNASRLLSTLGLLALVASSTGGQLAPDLESWTAPPEEAAAADVQTTLQNLPLYFVENVGQSDPRVRYYVPGTDTSVYFARQGITLALTASDKKERWNIKLDFLAANPEAEPRGEELTEGVVSYFRGDRDGWVTGAATYRRVVYEDLWPGIDLVYAGTSSRLKYSFIVRPGADAGQIRLGYRGVTDLRITQEGSLRVTTPVKSFDDDRPYVYQETGDERVEVAAAFELDSRNPHQYGFRLGAYDETRPLILDPVMLTYCGYIGGAGSNDLAHAVAVDVAGNVYITGETDSDQTTFPETVGPDLTYNGGTKDAFMAKVNPSGTSLIYCGYIGGSGSDEGKGIAIDSAGNAYITGRTTSADFPQSVGPDLSQNGASDAFVTKVNAAGTGLVYSGFIGGASGDGGAGIAVDGAGNAYVTGDTSSDETTFPETVGPDLTINGVQDAFVAKVDTSGAFLSYCGYIGGSATDLGLGIAVDGAGNAYVGGVTASTAATFPVSVGPDLTANGSDDAFVAKVNSSGTALLYAGYIGGSSGDRGNGIAVDSAGAAYVVGLVQSSAATFPETVGPDLTFGGFSDGFIAKVDASGSSLVYCGYLGGTGFDNASAVAVDRFGSAYVTGDTTNGTFPTLRGPDLSHNSSNDAFVLKVDVSGASFVYSGFIGGSTIDVGNGIAIDPYGNAYVVGRTQSTEASFPVLAGPDTTFNGGTNDAFLAKVAETGGTSYRSIGSYSFGNASVTAPPPGPQASNVVTFGGGASIPSWVGPGDRLTIEPGTASEDVFTVSSVDSPTQITITALTTASNFDHASAPYTLAWVYATGNAAVGQGSVSVTFGSGASLPARVGRGDKLILDPGGANQETLYVRARVSPTSVELERPAVQNHAVAESYRIERAYTRLQDWETARQGGLVAEERKEVGVAYEDGAFTTGITIDGSTTDAAYNITLTAEGSNRHYGLPGQGVVIDNGTNLAAAVDVRDDFVTVEWMEIKNGGASSNADGIFVNFQSPGSGSLVVLRNNLIHDTGSAGIDIGTADARLDVYNNITYGNTDWGIRLAAVGLNAVSRFRFLNNTLYNNNAGGFSKLPGASAKTLLSSNNISVGNAGFDYDLDPANSLDPASTSNLDEDGTGGAAHSPAGGAVTSTVPAVGFVNAAGGDLHITTGSTAENAGAGLSGVFSFDIDGGARVALWDIGADDLAATTEVALVSFEAAGADEAVELMWETASELHNLGFHLYRATSGEGPFQRITSNAIPGLGSSPVGAKYFYRDSGLVNGVTYFYELEDIETTGRRELHGPVSAMPEDRGDDEARTTYGDPAAVSFRVLERSPRGLLIELVTGGFWGTEEADGTVRLAVPGFDDLGSEGSPALPLKRTWLEVMAGRGVSIVNVRAFGETSLAGLRPANGRVPSVVASSEGTVRAGTRRARRAVQSTGLVPTSAARVVETGFQGDVKKALLELAPLRWDAGRGELLWARRLQVRLSFAGLDSSERASGGSRGRRHREERSHRSRTVLARLATTKPGLYRVALADALRSRRRPIASESLRLNHRGEAVPFRVESSALYFMSGGDSVYELELAPGGRAMSVLDASPSGPPVSAYLRRVEWEENRYYQAGLLDAPSLWFWDVLLSPGSKSYPFTLGPILPEEAALEVFLQAASDFDASPEHRVRVTVNGIPVGEVLWDGKTAKKLEATLAPGVLREGVNELSIENAGGDAGAYSMVFLDRFVVTCARPAVAESGVLEGRFAHSGTVAVEDLSSRSLVVQTTPEVAWLRGAVGGSFHVEAGRSYFAVSPESVLEPTVRRATVSGLRDKRNRFDYLLIGPREFLPAAEPLLRLRRSQGLLARAVAIEEVYDEFGFGEATPEALKEFLEFAYHHWGAAPRYVVLFGDATYDRMDYLKTGAPDRVPAFMLKTSYLWTASDPSYAAVNGEDRLPDLALGRLPASTIDEARTLVEKVIEYEDTDQTLSGRTILVADNPDAAGNFERDSDEIAAGLLGREVQKIYLRELGSVATRRAIVDSLDRGASLLSYAGHGGIALWASENIFELHDVGNLSPQASQPIVMTMNCLNGYFHFPYFDALGEALVKARHKGAIASFSPSGLSLDRPAHVYQQALVAELVSERHTRLGDAVLAAQRTYAESGLFPELLSIYHLLGDPALRLR